MNNYYVTIVQEMLEVVSKGGDTSTFRRQLYYIRAEKLKNSLITDHLKITFWLNLYTAFHLILQKDGKQLNYRVKKIKIARNRISLHDIEHGILRKTKFNIGFGYISNPFYSSFIKSMAVGQLEYKIHFAIQNVKISAKKPIVFDIYTVEQQLQDVTTTLLNEQTKELPSEKILISPSYLRQYAADFGGRKCIKKILQHNLNKDLSDYQLKFNNSIAKNSFYKNLQIKKY